MIRRNFELKSFKVSVLREGIFYIGWYLNSIYPILGIGSISEHIISSHWKKGVSTIRLDPLSLKFQLVQRRWSNLLCVFRAQNGLLGKGFRRNSPILTKDYHHYNVKRLLGKYSLNGFYIRGIVGYKRRSGFFTQRYKDKKSSYLVGSNR